MKPTKAYERIIVILHCFFIILLSSKWMCGKSSTDIATHRRKTNHITRNFFSVFMSHNFHTAMWKCNSCLLIEDPFVTIISPSTEDNTVVQVLFTFSFQWSSPTYLFSAHAISQNKYFYRETSISNRNSKKKEKSETKLSSFHGIWKLQISSFSTEIKFGNKKKVIITKRIHYRVCGRKKESFHSLNIN